MSGVASAGQIAQLALARVAGVLRGAALALGIDLDAMRRAAEKRRASSRHRPHKPTRKKRRAVEINPRKFAERALAQAELRRDAARVAAIGVHPKYRNASQRAIGDIMVYRAERPAWDEAHPRSEFVRIAS